MSWGDSAEKLVSSRGVATVNLVPPTPADVIRTHVLHPLLRRFAPDLEPYLRLQAPIRVKGRFESWALRHRVELAFLNYSFSSSLIEGHGDYATACDILDPLVANYRIQSRCKVRRIDLAAPPKGLEPVGKIPNPTSWGERKELERLKLFDGLICISAREHREMLANPMAPTSTLLPMSFPPVEALGPPSLDAPAGMFLGDNPHNLEALAWFLRMALPKIRRRIPEFRILVAGSISDRLSGDVQGIERIGKVETPASFYSRVGLVLCPTFSGTGEQIKIGEAMSYGRATISFEWMSSPVVHDQDGLQASSEKEFVDGVVSLGTDPRRCASMGASARRGVLDRRGAETFRTALDCFLRETLGSRVVPSRRV